MSSTNAKTMKISKIFSLSAIALSLLFTLCGCERKSNPVPVYDIETVSLSTPQTILLTTPDKYYFREIWKLENNEWQVVRSKNSSFITEFLTDTISENSSFKVKIFFYDLGYHGYIKDKIFNIKID